MQEQDNDLMKKCCTDQSIDECRTDKQHLMSLYGKHLGNGWRAEVVER